MDYAGWITSVATILEYPLVDATTAAPTASADFNAMIPSAIDYTENRLQRDLDFIATTVTSTGTMTPNSRTLTLPSVDLPTVGNIPDLVGDPIPPNSVITTTLNSNIVNVYWPEYNVGAGDFVSLLTPLKVGGLTLGGVYNIITAVDANNFTLNVTFLATSSASATVVGSGIYIVCTQIRPIVGGKRLQPLEATTRDYLDFAWPDEDSVGSGILPVQWCPNDQSAILIGPAPDIAYGFEVVGTMRIPQLSPTNYTNFLSQNVPDLYVAASMVFFSGYQGNYGTQSEDPAKSQSWEAQYQMLLKSAQVEEIRKTYSNMFPSPSSPSGLTAQG